MSMSDSSVFCPKCGTPSDDGARFCRKCGTNLEAVSRALTGSLVPPSVESPGDEIEIAYAKEFSRASYQLLGSIATFLAFLLIFRGQWWVFFLLLWVANNVRDLVHASLLKREIKNPAAFQAALAAFHDEKDEKRKRKREKRELRKAKRAGVLPAAAPADLADAPRTTGEIEKPKELAFDPLNPPPSVTEGTTRLLDENGDGAGYRKPPDSVANS
jgi:hypothetical protein